MKKIKLLFHNVQLRGNIYLALLLSLLLIMMLFSLCRLGFLLFNLAFFSKPNAADFFRIFAGGLKFDLTAVLYVNAIFIVLVILPFKFRFNVYYRKVAQWIF